MAARTLSSKMSVFLLLIWYLHDVNLSQVFITINIPQNYSQMVFAITCILKFQWRDFSTSLIASIFMIWPWTEYEQWIDLFRGAACAVNGNVPVVGHVKRVDHGDAFDARRFVRKRSRVIISYTNLICIRTNLGKTEGIFLYLQSDCPE